MIVGAYIILLINVCMRLGCRTYVVICWHAHEETATSWGIPG
jgi:hypothetical protein